MENLDIQHKKHGIILLLQTSSIPRLQCHPHPIEDISIQNNKHGIGLVMQTSSTPRVQSTYSYLRVWVSSHHEHDSSQLHLEQIHRQAGTIQ